jgi:hypothetical protein
MVVILVWCLLFLLLNVMYGFSYFMNVWMYGYLSIYLSISTYKMNLPISLVMYVLEILIKIVLVSIAQLKGTCIAICRDQGSNPGHATYSPWKRWILATRLPTQKFSAVWATYNILVFKAWVYSCIFKKCRSYCSMWVFML